MNELAPLPALASLDKLKGSLPTLLIDTREQTPLAFTRLESIPGTLTSGDYSVAGLEELFAIERKSVSDLVGCCAGSNRERFERELHRLRGYRFARILVVGEPDEITEGRYHSRIKPQSVWATLYAFEARYNLPVVFQPSAEVAAAWVENLAYWFARETILNANGLARVARTEY
jgi:DNA excision repair protein ERCC-4